MTKEQREDNIIAIARKVMYNPSNGYEYFERQRQTDRSYGQENLRLFRR